MTHIELSLSPPVTPRMESAARDPLEKWIGPVSTAEESCLVIDADGIIAAASIPWAELLGHDHPRELMGRHLVHPDVLPLIDFTAAGNSLGEAERDQIPPLLALSSGQLSRGLLRVRLSSNGPIRTLDAIATPLHIDGHVVGVLAFFTNV